MQDEVNTKVVAIAIKGGKITAEVLKKALAKFIEEIEKAEKQASQPKTYRGKQSIKHLMEQNQLFDACRLFRHNKTLLFDLVTPERPMPSRCQNQKERAQFQHIFFHPDFAPVSVRVTVGSGVAPNQRLSARGLYRRWGIAPRPEDTVQFPYKIARLRPLVKRARL